MINFLPAKIRINSEQKYIEALNKLKPNDLVLVQTFHPIDKLIGGSPYEYWMYECLQITDCLKTGEIMCEGQLRKSNDKKHCFIDGLRTNLAHEPIKNPFCSRLVTYFDASLAYSQPVYEPEWEGDRIVLFCPNNNRRALVELGQIKQQMPAYNYKVGGGELVICFSKKINGEDFKEYLAINRIQQLEFLYYESNIWY